MFSLIIVLISIVLVAALVVATVYYGGSLWSDGEAQARAATVVNQGEQIVGAAKLYAIEKGHPVAQLSDLVAEGYLSSIPMPPSGLSVASLNFSVISSAYAADPTWVWDASTESLSLVRQVAEPQVCSEVNKLSFSVEDVKDAVDTRLRVQCYGSSAPYTVLWDARAIVPLEAPAKHTLCLATEHINHVPAQCGSAVISGAQLDTPTQVSLSSYPNALGPIDWIPALPPEYWANRNGQTCSTPQNYGTALPAIQYVVTAPVDSVLTLMFDEQRAILSDDPNASYYYSRAYATRVFVDGQQVSELTATDTGSTPQVVPGISVTAGTHTVRLEFTASLAPRTDTYGNPYPPEMLPATAPQTDVCISGLQMPLLTLPAVTPPATLPEPGHIRLDNVSCSIDQYPYTAEFWYFKAWYDTWEYASAAPTYGVTINTMTIVGTPETLADFGGVIRAAWRQGATVPPDTELWINEYISSGYHLVRSSPTTYSLVSPIIDGGGVASHIRQYNCQTGTVYSDAYTPCMTALLNELTQPTPKTFDIELTVEGGGFVADNTFTCTSNPVRRKLEPIGMSMYGDFYWGDPATGQPLAGFVGAQTCGDGLGWDATLNKCVCKPSATSVCAAPNGPLSSGLTNTNSGVTCTSASCQSLPWAPVSAP